MKYILVGIDAARRTVSKNEVLFLREGVYLNYEGSLFRCDTITVDLVEKEVRFYLVAFEFKNNG